MSGITNFIIDIKTLLNQARNKVYKSVNSIMTQTYFEIGKRIVQEEQRGKSRADYGKNLLKNLSQELTKEFGKGVSVRNLEQMRKFYLVYQNSKTVSANFPLSWSHYIFLSRIQNDEERNFYEIEATENSWSLRELRRQFDSAFKYQMILPKKEDLKNLLMDSGNE